MAQGETPMVTKKKLFAHQGAHTTIRCTSKWSTKVKKKKKERKKTQSVQVLSFWISKNTSAGDENLQAAELFKSAGHWRLTGSRTSCGRSIPT